MMVFLFYSADQLDPLTRRVNRIGWLAEW